ncbi:MAG: hypothetical protein COB17_00830 [Sulfurimonas sp.]|nr:MAG: hypothetical protein COB17_00830 [Sulfurimonas sp.]
MATYIRLTDYKSSDAKEQEFFNLENRYEAKQEDFYKITGYPIAYWVSSNVHNIFNKGIRLKKFGDTRQGMATSDNNRFLRSWFEVDIDSSGFNFNNAIDASKSSYKWFPYNKGGEAKKWYGNLEFLINYENDGFEVKEYASKLYKTYSRTIKSIDRYFERCISWSKVSSSGLSLRYFPNGFAFDVAGCSIFENDNELFYIMALLNTKLQDPLISSISPTINFEAGQLANVPIIFPKQASVKEKIEIITQQNIDISKEEWDSRETSWDFTKNELIKHKSDSKIETAYTSFYNYWKEQHNTLHQNEEELNRLFIDIYELQDELTPDVELKDITILKNETKIVDDELVFQVDEIMKQFISYGVGVMFGRYSLDSDRLLIANMGQEIPSQAENDKVTFEIDDDNVIPVLEDDYFKDDIASRFVQFVKATFGEEYLSENIRFIESSLGTTLRKYFVKGFYEDHIKRYKKRPIYWMVASPKKSFMSLIYMHRYEADTFARVRNSYLTEYITKLEAHKETLTLTTSSDTASDRDKKDADKQMKNIDTKLKEIIEFDRDKMMSWSQNPTEIDLDDGVKVNYCKFKDILYPITGLCK